MSAALAFAMVAAMPFPRVVFNSQPGPDTSNASTYTFTSADIGVAKTRRYVVVGVFVGALSGVGITGVTLGGNSMTPLGSIATSTFTAIRFFGLQVDAGTTGTIVVTAASASVNCAVGVWSLYDLESFTATDTGTNTNDPGTDALTINNGGVGLAIASNASALSAYSWTGLTEQFDSTVEAGNAMSWSGAHLQSTSTQNLSVSATRGGGVSDTLINTISFR